MSESAWQDEEVARAFLEDRRAAIPYGPDQVQMMLQIIRQFHPGPQVVMDLGCGDGFLARTLLDAYPAARAVLLDNSEPMLQRARQAMAPYGDRCQILAADLCDPIHPYAPADVDLIVSGYAIHHLPHPRKMTLYEETYTLLAPGGLFINLEHVASPTPELEALWDQLYVDHITASTGKPREEVAHSYFNRPDKSDNILERVETQVGWLREIGFEHADCYFKWLELAVFGGVKTG